jgi:hypothetical protein
VCSKVRFSAWRVKSSHRSKRFSFNFVHPQFIYMNRKYYIVCVFFLCRLKINHELEHSMRLFLDLLAG